MTSIENQLDNYCLERIYKWIRENTEFDVDEVDKNRKILTKEEIELYRNNGENLYINSVVRGLKEEQLKFFDRFYFKDINCEEEYRKFQLRRLKEAFDLEKLNNNKESLSELEQLNVIKRLGKKFLMENKAYWIISNPDKVERRI